MSWHPDLAAAFTSVTGGRARLTDLHVSVTAHSLNVGLSPVIDEAIPALTRGRLAHVDQHYLRPDTYTAANAVLIHAQAAIGLAQAWGGGLVAAVDGVRFVVPVRSIDARRNPKYFARKKGVTWLNMISDQRIGLAGRVISGTTACAAPVNTSAITCAPTRLRAWLIPEEVGAVHDAFQHPNRDNDPVTFAATSV